MSPRRVARSVRQRMGVDGASVASRFRSRSRLAGVSRVAPPLFVPLFVPARRAVALGVVGTRFGSDVFAGDFFLALEDFRGAMRVEAGEAPAAGARARAPGVERS
jgi:hypothetical protein